MADKQTLDDAQSLVTEKYLGQAGIHGVGIRRKKSALALYVEPGATQEHKDLLKQIGDEVKPYDLIVVEEERSSIK